MERTAGSMSWWRYRQVNLGAVCTAEFALTKEQPPSNEPKGRNPNRRRDGSIDRNATIWEIHAVRELQTIK